MPRSAVVPAFTVPLIEPGAGWPLPTAQRPALSGVAAPPTTTTPAGRAVSFAGRQLVTASGRCCRHRHYGAVEEQEAGVTKEAGPAEVGDPAGAVDSPVAVSGWSGRHTHGRVGQVASRRPEEAGRAP